MGGNTAWAAAHPWGVNSIRAGMFLGFSLTLGLSRTSRTENAASLEATSGSAELAGTDARLQDSLPGQSWIEKLRRVQESLVEGIPEDSFADN